MPTKTGQERLACTIRMPVPAAGDPEFAWEAGSRSRRALVEDLLSANLRDAARAPEEFPAIHRGRPAMLFIEFLGKGFGNSDFREILTALEEAAAKAGTRLRRQVSARLAVNARWVPEKEVAPERGSGRPDEVERDIPQKPPKGSDRAAHIEESLQRLLTDLPDEYEARRAVLLRLGDGVRAAIARALQGPLNAQAAAMPHATYEEKKTLAKWVNAELRRFGLVIKCPKTGHAAILIGHPSGTPGVGRFHMEYTDETGRRHRSVTSASLPRLDLTLDDLTRGSYTEPPSQSR